MVVMRTCNSSIWEEEVGGSLGGQGQPGLHRKTLSQKKKKPNKQKTKTKNDWVPCQLNDLTLSPSPLLPSLWRAWI